MNSTAAQARGLQSDYVSILGRPIDSNGLLGYGAGLQAGISLVDVADALFTSTEYVARASGAVG